MGSVKWCWPQNYAGIIKWEVNQPQLKVLKQPLEETECSTEPWLKKTYNIPLHCSYMGM